MTDKILDYSNISFGESPNKAFVLIHGWQGNKDSFKSIPGLIGIENSMWYLPEAPYMVDNNSDKKTWTFKKSDGTFEINEPKKLFLNFLNDIVFKNFESKDVYVMGFSQGAAVCYEMILSLDCAFG